MTIQSEVATKSGLKAVVYTASRNGRQMYTTDVYALVIDESKGKFRNLSSACVVKKKEVGGAKFGSRILTSYLEQARQVCKDWAAA